MRTCLAVVDTRLNRASFKTRNSPEQKGTCKCVEWLLRKLLQRVRFLLNLNCMACVFWQLKSYIVLLGPACVQEEMYRRMTSGSSSVSCHTVGH